LRSPSFGRLGHPWSNLEVIFLVERNGSLHRLGIACVGQLPPVFVISPKEMLDDYSTMEM
jgi:hypothetical protein